MSKSLALVIATIRPESFKRWFDAWFTQLDEAGVAVYVVEDGGKSGLRDLVISAGWNHCSWSGIERELGKNAWIIPRHTSAIKSFGFLKAHQDGHDYIWALDDDCFPERGTDYPATLTHLLGMRQAAEPWWNTITETGLYPRGYPYGVRQHTEPVMIHHGLWSGVPDLDGITALEHHELRLDPATGVDRVPPGQFFPMCGMNLSFRREVTPAMYFMLQGDMAKPILSPVTGKHPLEKLPFDRFDDIWAGLFAKKICDHLGYAVTSGSPSIIHTKESDPTMRVIKEGPGIAAHELLWPVIADTRVPAGGSVIHAYSWLTGVVDSAASDLPFPDYWRKLAEAMHLWTELF